MAKQSKSAKIRALLDKGLQQKDIVKKLKTSYQLVHIVARNYGKTNKPPIRKGLNKDGVFISKLLALVDSYRKEK